jgi:cytochrome c oxidase accessory protein FixG
MSRIGNEPFANLWLAFFILRCTILSQRRKNLEFYAMNEEDKKIYEDLETYRDNLATVDQSGKRIWIYPKKPKGRFYNWRIVTAVVLVALLVGIPFLKVNGEPILLFNVLEGRFILFSIVFTPQDMHLFALAMVTLVVFVVLFTVVFGRLFCGWVCPQTVFMEMVFRKIEYWIEGDANQQRRLNQANWDATKILKKVSKHLIFYGVAVVISNIFLSYIIGADAVLKIISEPVGVHINGFAAMLIFAGLFYGVFAFMREQVCTTICPYGRLQGVLLVSETIVVHYDFVRGEPRGKIQKDPIASIKNAIVSGANHLEPEAGEKPLKLLGDCIGCKLCVQVCPTGIDIRNGTQLECVNCTACIDACDEVMEKVHRPKGLVRYDSFNGVKEGTRKIFNTRAIAYSGVLAALIIFQAFLFAVRSDVEALVLRVPGQLYQKVDETHYSNLFNWEVVNKTAKDIEHIEFRLAGMPEGKVRHISHSDNLVATKQGLLKGVFFIDMPKSLLKGTKTKLTIEVYSGDRLLDKTTTNFSGPVQ